MRLLGFLALVVATLAVAAWALFFAVSVDEDCGRLDDCALPPTTLYIAAWALTAVAVVLGFLWLRRWAASGRNRGPASPPR